MHIYHLTSKNLHVLTCPGCNITFRVARIIHPIRCSCGGTPVIQETLTYKSHTQYEQRRVICNECPHRSNTDQCTLLPEGRNFIEGTKGIHNPQARCPDSRWPKSYPPVTIRNLIYHVYPVGDWESIAAEVAKYSDIFTKRVIAVASLGGNVDHVVNRCKQMFSTDNVTVYPNDPELRETVTFPPLLNAVLNDNPNEATFYAHTKANSTAGNVGAATSWRKVMVKYLLDKWEEATTHLQSHIFVGTHKMIWPTSVTPPFPTHLHPTHPWMHCGTFWWFRHDEVTKLHSPKYIVPDRYGVEAWPAQLIPHTKAFSMWQPWKEHESAWPQRNPYDPRLYAQEILS